MKKAEEYFKEHVGYKLQGVLDPEDKSIIEAIKQAQLDAIEETVKRCAEEAKTKRDSYWELTAEEQSICEEIWDEGYSVPHLGILVDKQSILSVADKMQAEITNR